MAETVDDLPALLPPWGGQGCRLMLWLAFRLGAILRPMVTGFHCHGKRRLYPHIVPFLSSHKLLPPVQLTFSPHGRFPPEPFLLPNIGGSQLLRLGGRPFRWLLTGSFPRSLGYLFSYVRFDGILRPGLVWIFHGVVRVCEDASHYFVMGDLGWQLQGTFCKLLFQSREAQLLGGCECRHWVHNSRGHSMGSVRAGRH